MIKKTLFIVLCLTLLFPLVLAETGIVKTDLKVVLDKDLNLLKITGENLDWSKTVNLSNGSISESITEELEIVLVREFKNATEVSSLLEVCQNNLNFTQKWKECVNLNTQLDIQNRKMVNQSVLEECKENITSILHKSELDKQKLEEICRIDGKTHACSSLIDQRDKYQKQKNWFLIGLGLSLVFLFFIWKKYVGINPFTKSFESRDKPMDHSF